MASLQLLIDTNFLTSFVRGIDKNVDVGLLESSIYTAQLANILPVLQNALYNKLVSLASTKTMSGVYFEIYEILRPALAQWAYYQVLPELHLKTSNKGVVTLSDDNVTSADMEALKYKRSGIRDTAELLTAQLEKFLTDNKDRIPEYEDTTTGNTSYFSGIYFPKYVERTRY